MLPFPAVTLAAFPSVCIDLPPFILSGGSPAGGTYAIDGIPATIFNPIVQGTGSHTISYTYSDPFTNCVKTQEQPLIVNPLPVVNLAPLSNICLNAPGFNLSGGSPEGGISSGPGVSGGSLTHLSPVPGPIISSIVMRYQWLHKFRYEPDRGLSSYSGSSGSFYRCLY